MSDSNLSVLGEKIPHAIEGVEYFENPQQEYVYLIEFHTNEFTSLCPKTGQPDFATLHIRYVPDKRCVESKSLKLYLWSFRNQGKFHERCTNEITEHLVNTLDPHAIEVTGNFNVRGGINIDVRVKRVKTPGTEELL